MKHLYFLLTLLLLVPNQRLEALNFYAQATGNWSNAGGTVWFDAAVGGTAYGAGVFPGTGDDVFVNNGVSVGVDIVATCRNLFLDANTLGAVVILAPLTVEGTMLGWGGLFPAIPTTTLIGSQFGAPLIFTGTATNTTGVFALTNNEVIAYWNLASPLPPCNFNLASTGRISFVGAFVGFVFQPGDLAFINGASMSITSGTLETTNTSITGIRIQAGGLSISSGATFNLDVPINEDGMATSRINSISIDGDLICLDANTYVNSETISIGSTGSLITNFNGVDQTEGWWHTTASPNTTPIFDVNSTVNFQANADQAIPAFSYGNLIVEAVNGDRNKTVEGSGTFIVNGTFTVNSSSVIFGSNAAASSNLDFRGDIVNFGRWGTFVNDNIRLNGSAAQSISGGDPINIQNINLEVDNNSGVSVASNLELNQNLILTNGVLNQTSGSMTFSGSSDQVISGNGSANFIDLYVENDLDNESTITVAGILTLDPGVVFDADGLPNNGSLTLLSDATGSARLAPITGGANLGGNVTVQRFMGTESAGIPIFRYISSPVDGANVSDWSDDNPIASSNTYFYDETIPGASNSGWTLASSSTSLNDGRGFASLADASVDITLDLTGPVNQGSFTTNLDYTNGSGDDDVGWNLIGNPYPSAIDWDNVTRSGSVDPAVVVSSNGATGRVQYLWWDNGVGPLTGGIIGSGQAFWVLANAAGQSVTVTESSKITGDGPFYRTNDVVQDLLTIHLSDGLTQDVTYIRLLEEATPEYDESIDMLKRSNGIFNITSLSEDEKHMAINAYDQLENGKLIPLDIYNIDPGSYTFSIEETFASEVQFVLIDRFLDEEVPIEQNDSGPFEYSFEVTTDPLTYGVERFRIQVGRSIITTLDDEFNGVSIYPNPVGSGELLNLNISGLFDNIDPVEIVIMDRKGSAVSRSTLSPNINGTIQLNMDSYSSGMYILKLIGSNATHHYKVIKN